MNYNSSFYNLLIFFLRINDACCGYLNLKFALVLTTSGANDCIWDFFKVNTKHRQLI